MNETEAIRCHLDRYRSILVQQIDRLVNALEELQRTTLLLLDIGAGDDAAIDRWLADDGFGVDAHGFFLSLPLQRCFREKRLPEDAISVSWGRHLVDDPTARRHLYAHRRIGPHLKRIHERLESACWIYYQDASNTALQYPYIDQCKAIPFDFDWTLYHTWQSVCPANNPQRAVRWTPPTIDYAGQGLIISVSIPVWRANAFIGLWSIDLPLRFIYRDFATARPFADQTQFIVDAKGMLLLHERIPAEIDAQKGSVYFRPLKDLGGEWSTLSVDELGDADDGCLTVRDGDGSVWAMCHTRVPGVDWILFSGLLKKVMTETATQELQQAFRQIGDGNFSHRIDPAEDDNSLAPVTQAFNRMSLRLEKAEALRRSAEAQLLQAQRMESIGRLAGGVAHDFNNMLSVIMGTAELMSDRFGPDDPAAGELKDILAAARRAMEITRQLLAFARRQPIAPKLLDINDTVEHMLNMLRRLIGEDIDLTWHPGRHVPPVMIDPSQVDQILANLCVNARDAISDVGKVTIETGEAALDADYCNAHRGFKPGDYVTLSVSDDGIGMDGAVLDKIFEPFFSTKAIGRGTGLGLATVYGIVKQNDGFVNVYSEPGHGTTFKIYLPGQSGTAAAAGDDTKTPPAPGRGETVLIVEDERAILKLGRKMLESLAYRVLDASTPETAIRIAEDADAAIDLLLTDVIMPEMNGRDLAERLLALHPGLRVIYMSGYTADAIAHRSILDKNINFIQKPFTKKDLAAKVRTVLDGADGAAGGR